MRLIAREIDERPAPSRSGDKAAASNLQTVRVCMYTAESRMGHARYTRDLLSALARTGVERGVAVELVTSRDLASPYRNALYPIHRILPPLEERASYRSTLTWGAGRVAHYVRRERTFLRWVAATPDLDVVHIQEYTPWLAPGHFRWLRRRGLRVAATVHNIANHGHFSRSYARMSQRCLLSAWRACSALLVHTDGLRGELARFLGPGHPPIHVTPHAVWEERTTPPQPISRGDGEPARLLFFGMIRPNKGLHVLLEAMERLSDCVLTVAGYPEDEGYLARIRALVDRLPSGRVELVTRFVAEGEIAGLFDRAHLIVLPYTSFASQSGVLHQALAHARPVVATEVGGLGESVRAWKIGEVVAPGDARSLAVGLERALEPERYAAATEATLRVRGELTWTKMAEATLDVYRTLVP